MMSSEEGDDDGRLANDDSDVAKTTEDNDVTAGSIETEDNNDNDDSGNTDDNEDTDDNDDNDDNDGP